MTDDYYAARGYAPKLTVRFVNAKAYTALERLARREGVSRTAILERLILAQSPRRRRG